MRVASPMAAVAFEVLAEVVLLESMKMEVLVLAPVIRTLVNPGDLVQEGDPLLVMDAG